MLIQDVKPRTGMDALFYNSVEKQLPSFMALVTPTRKIVVSDRPKTDVCIDCKLNAGYFAYFPVCENCEARGEWEQDNE